MTAKPFALGVVLTDNTFPIDNSNRFGAKLDTPSEALINDPTFFTASGHVRTQDRDDVVLATTLHQTFCRGNVDPQRIQPCVLIRLMPGLGAQNLELGRLGVLYHFEGPPLIALAVGDLDQVPDAEGINHDEAAVAWASNVSSDQTSVDVNLAVVNYASATPVVTILPNVMRLFPGLLRSESRLTDQLFAVAMGDFAGDGQTELAVAAITGGGEFEGQFWRLQIYRYSRASLASAPVLTLMSDRVYNYVTLLGRNVGFTPTISLAAGDFKGDGKKDELMVALNFRVIPFGSNPISRNLLQVIEVNGVNGGLVQTLRAEGLTDLQNLDGQTNQTRIKAVPGFFALRAGLYGRQVALAWNDRRPANDPSASQQLNVQTFSMSRDLGSISALTAPLRLDNKGVDASFDLVAGGFAVNGRINNPNWTLAVSQSMFNASGMMNKLSMISGLNTPGELSITQQRTDPACEGSEPQCPVAAPSNKLRWPLTADDYQGGTIRFGAPLHFRIKGLINTDFVLQEPPKHAYWDTKNKNVVNISRFPGIQTSLKTMEGQTFDGKTKDTSSYSIGGSTKVSASLSAQAGESTTIGSAKVSAELVTKTSYNFDQKEDDYNSNYAEQTLTEAAAAENDDLITGRYQTFDIWRYRVLGVPKVIAETDANPPATFEANEFYDVVLPGPELRFNGGGLSLDWYQPLHENGNILSYPAPSGGHFNPIDLGTFKIPCPAADKIPPGSECNADGTLSVAKPMIPADQKFVDATSGSISIDYNNNFKSGDTITTEHKFAESTDVKAGFSLQVGGKENNVTLSGSEERNFSEGGSWGGLTTTESSTSKKTGITVARTSIPTDDGYAFYPVFYSAKDGTIKVAHAADPLGSNAGKSFWAGLYGAKADPALNLPLRFTRLNTIAVTWIPNTDISRKQMRGFFVLSENPNPITGQYDILGQTPVTGDKVRLSAQVYNYSTGVAFHDCEVKFSAVKYNPVNNTESGPRVAIGTTHVSLEPRGNTPAQMIWDTTRFGPATGSESQAYRIYVQLNYNGAIDEIYPPENPSQTYGTGLPIGVDPGQNDEGFGYATVMAPKSASSTTQVLASAATQAPEHLYLGSQALEVGGPGGLTDEAGLLVEQVGAQVPMRVQVCASQPTREIADAVVFDGPPADGKVVAWKRVPVANGTQCNYAWFEWVPDVGGVHNLTAEVLQDVDDPRAGHNQTSLNVEVVGR